jgi:hypothetical protein
MSSRNETTHSAQISNHVDAMYGFPIRLPPFWPTKVELWFQHLEAQLAFANITKDDLKFAYVVGQLDQKVLE